MIFPATLLALASFATAAHDESAVVNTTLGRVGGEVLRTKSGEESLLFKGLPFADPPVGHLRFRPSRLFNRPWPGVMDATDYQADCIMTQNNGYVEVAEQLEDCLYLNVYTNRKCLDSGSCPVLMYIFGGGFSFGTPREYDPELMTDHFVSKDIVFVIPNYRMNVFASWNMGSNDAPGNLWTYDHLIALMWIEREIGAFGGDKDQVTIMGDSSGGMCVSLLTLSPLSNTLFHAAVPMSGNANTNIIFGGLKSNQSAVTAQKCGCIENATEWETKDKNEIIRCMQQLPAKKIQEAFGVSLSIELPVGNELFPGALEALLDARPPLKILAGVTGREFAGYVRPAVAALGMKDSTLKLAIYGLCLMDMSFFGLQPSFQLANACVKYYGSLGLDVGGQMGELISDVMFYLPSFLDVRNITKVGGSGYLYSFDYVPRGEDPGSYPAHAQDLEYLMWHHKDYYSRTDKKVEKAYANMFADFVKLGSIDAPAVKSTGFASYLSIDKKPKVLKDFHKSAYTFWMETAPSIAANGKRWIPEETVAASRDVANTFLRNVDDAPGKDVQPYIGELISQAATLGASISGGREEEGGGELPAFTMVTGGLFTVLAVGLLASLFIAVRAKNQYQRIPEL